MNGTGLAIAEDTAKLFQPCLDTPAPDQPEYEPDSFPSTMQLFLEELGLSNSTADLDSGSEFAVLVSLNHTLRLYYRPLLIVAGVIGNLLAWLVFTQSKLRKFSCSPYLAAIAFTDNLFLLVLFVVWMGGLGYDIYNSGGWCQAITYASYACTFLPVWFCVAMAVDRTLFVVCVDSRYRYCTTLRSKLVIAGLTVVAIVVYLNVSLLSGVVKTYRSTHVCVPLPRFSSQVVLLDKMDALVNVLLPYLTLILLCLLLCRYLICCYKNKPEIAFRPIRPGHRRPNSWDKTELLFTKTLLFMLGLYLVLNLPSYLLRLCVMFASMHSGSYAISKHLILWQQLFMHVFFTRFACNFYVYVAVSDTFRKHLSLVAQLCLEKLHSLSKRIRTHKRRESTQKSSSSSSVVMSNGSTQMQVIECTV